MLYCIHRTINYTVTKNRTLNYEMAQEVPNTKPNWKRKTQNHSHCYMLKQREQIKGMVNFGEKKKLLFLSLCPSIKFSLGQIKIKNISLSKYNYKV